jgi:DNA-binding transcriptional LysR family regulator
MEIRHLRYFSTIAEELHVTRAAERLHIAQPALTAQMRALEAELRVPLLRREGRGIQLTSAGEVFYRECVDILERLGLAVLRVAEAADGRCGRITIGLIESAAYSRFITQILRRYRRRWPQVEMTLKQKHSTDLYQELAAKKIDVAFLRPPAPSKGRFESHTVLDEALYVAVPRDHPWARRQSIRLSEVGAQPLVLGTSGERVSPIESQLRDLFSKASPEINVINLVSAGLGISIVPHGLCNVRRTEVSFIPLITRPRIRAQIAFVTRLDESAPTVLHLRSLTLKAYGKHR